MIDPLCGCQETASICAVHKFIYIHFVSVTRVLQKNHLATAMSRFASAVSDAKQEECQANAMPANTRYVTLWGIRMLEEWATDRVPAGVWREKAP